MRRNPISKLIVVSLVGILVLWLIQALLVSAGTGMSLGYGRNFVGHHYGGGMYMGGGFVYGGTATYILMFLIKILFVLFTLGLVGGIVVWVKNSVFSTEEREAIKNTFTCKTAVTKETCSICGKELSSEWKVCPYCGKEK